jgi:hypothetical protein
MHIVFGEVARDIRERYTVLELDTFCDPVTGRRATAWCVVENLALPDIMSLVDLSARHAEIMPAYQAQQWDTVSQICHELRGRWNGDLDSFYDVMIQRVSDLQNNQPSADWDGSIPRSLDTVPQ